MADDAARDIVVLAGGVGAARFLEGVVQAVAPERVTAIVNTVGTYLAGERRTRVEEAGGAADPAVSR